MALLTVGPTFDQAENKIPKQNFVVNIGDSEIRKFGCSMTWARYKKCVWKEKHWFIICYLYVVSFILFCLHLSIEVCSSKTDKKLNKCIDWFFLFLEMLNDSNLSSKSRCIDKFEIVGERWAILIIISAGLLCAFKKQ